MRFINYEMDLSVFLTADAWLSLLTLTLLEIVLGIDNIIFISILSGRLPQMQQKSARRIGLIIAMVTRVLLLLSLSWIIRMDNDLFTVIGKGISGREIVLIAGGLFLIYKATVEIHSKIEGDEGEDTAKIKSSSFISVIIQIVLFDIVFSLDSVITAIGMANHVIVMAIAVVVAVLIMLFAADGISNFVNKHPTIKMLALSFLVLIGFALIMEGWGERIEKGYIYFAMGFAVLVEMLNLWMKKNALRKKN